MAGQAARVRFERVAARRWLTRAMVGAICVAALTVIEGLLLGGFGQVEGRILLTTLTVCGVVLAAVAATDQAEYRPRLTRLGGGTASLCLVAMLLAVWTPSEARAWDGLARIAAVAVVVGIAVAHAALLLPRPPGSDDPVVGAAVFSTLILNGLLSLLLMGLMVSTSPGPEGTTLLIVALTLLDALGILLVLTLRSMGDATGTDGGAT
jgi:hypothetical protein